MKVEDWVKLRDDYERKESQARIERMAREEAERRRQFRERTARWKFFALPPLYSEADRILADMTPVNDLIH